MFIRNVDIAIWIKNKYQNNIIPRIPEYVTKYVFEHKDKYKLYLNENININDILTFIANEFKQNRNAKVIDLIIEYVEKHHES